MKMAGTGSRRLRNSTAPDAERYLQFCFSCRGRIFAPANILEAHLKSGHAYRFLGT